MTDTGPSSTPPGHSPMAAGQPGSDPVEEAPDATPEPKAQPRPAPAAERPWHEEMREDAEARKGPGAWAIAGKAFAVFPKMALPMVVYAILALAFGLEFVRAGTLFGLPTLSAAMWEVSPGDLILILGLVFLFIEVIKSAQPKAATVLSHAVSFFVFIIGLLLFLLAEAFASSVFFLLTLMALLDTVAGLVIGTAVAARGEPVRRSDEHHKDAKHGQRVE
jgi:hypothetical protein